MQVQEPIVLIGGFGSHWSDYKDAARVLANLSGRRVFISGMTRVTWMMAGLTNYSVLVDRAHAAIFQIGDVEILLPRIQRETIDATELGVFRGAIGVTASRLSRQSADSPGGSLDFPDGPVP